MTRALFAAVLALGSFLAFSSSAFAYSVSYEVEASLWNQNDGNGLSFSTGPLTQTSVSESFQISAETNALLIFGTASIGRLSGTSAAQVYDAGDLSGTRGSETMSFTDTITAIGPPGTMVNFLATLSMASVVDFVGVGPCVITSAFAGVSATVGGGTLDVGNFGGCQSAPSSPQTRAFQVLAGSSFPVISELIVFANVEAGVTSFAYAEATAIFNLDVQTPGASYLTESGLSFATDVPEPGTLLLTSLGLAALVARRRAPQVLHRA
jgi:hypothetical protein